MAEFVPIHGNYRGYYTKRPAARDPRLELIPKDVLTGSRVLDVGCNEGWITCEVALHRGAKEVVGVDIDDNLIRAAWKRRRTVWSQHPQLSSSPIERGPPPSKKARFIRDSDEREHEFSFPVAFEHMFGPLQIPPAADPDSRGQFPHNVLFRTTDWPRDGAIEDKDSYDVVLALSITKWIHLNDGDAGLLAFFQRIFSVLQPDGVFILEPQEWETYHKAKRMDVKLKKNAETLKLRPTDFERELMKIGFRSVEHLGRTGQGGFQRELDLYRK